MAKDLEIIYLEGDEEIPSVIGRLDEIKGKEVIFVVPKEAILIHSLINLRLLGREADKREKKVNIVTTDEAGINLSKKAGFAVFESVNDAKVAESVVEEEPEKEAETESVLPAEEVPTEEDFAPSSAPKEPVRNVSRSNISGEAKIVKSVSPKSSVRKDFGWPKFHFNHITAKKILVIGGVLVVIALGVLAYLYLPSAKITLYVQASSKNTDMNFTLAQNPQAGELTSQILEVDKEKSAQAPATGQKDQGAKATGKITIYNDGWSTTMQTLVAGTRLQATSSNLIVNQVNVPGYSQPNGPSSMVMGSVTADVVADDIGAQYNIAPDRFFIPGLSTDKQAKMYGQSDQPMTGGIKKTVKVVSQEDCDKAINSIKDGLTKDAQKDLANQAKGKTDYIFNPALIFPQDISSSCDPVVGTQTDQFTAKAKVRYEAFLYKNSDLKALLKTQAQKGLDPKKDISADSFSKFDITNTQADLANKKVVVKINTNVIIIPKIDINLIKNNLLGKDYDSAVKYLNSVTTITKSDVILTPSFIKRVSRYSNRVTIEIKEAK